MEEDFSASMLAECTENFPHLTPKNQGRVLAYIILLLESQKQAVEWPKPPKKRR